MVVCPLSQTLATHLREIISLGIQHINGCQKSDELTNAVLAAQAETSHLPSMGECLIELFQQEGKKNGLANAQYCFVHAFAGRHVHEGLGALLALRLGRLNPCRVWFVSMIMASS